MNKCILLGIDAPLSSATRQAIRTIKDLIGPDTAQYRLLLLHVIPVSHAASPALGMYTGQLQSSTFSAEQRLEAEKVLVTVRGALREQTLDELRVDICIRTGSPADEIIKMACEVHADLVVVGSRGNTTRERVRRFLLGSKSRRVLECVDCPVMIVALPRVKFSGNLVAWYEEAITRYLNEHAGGLTVLTPLEVVQLFAPPPARKPSGRKEQAAAILALEKLARDGVLCRHDIKGEMRYVND